MQRAVASESLPRTRCPDLLSRRGAAYCRARCETCFYADLLVMPTGAMIHQVSPAQRRLRTTSSRHNFRATRKAANRSVTDGSGTRMCVNVGAAGSCRVKPRWNQACTVSTPSDTVCLWSADRPCRPPRSSARRRRLCRPARDPTCVKAGKARTAKPSSRHNRKVGIRGVIPTSE